jgi:hypothetical protein
VEPSDEDTVRSPRDHLDDDEELILRGGELDPDILRADAQRMFDIYGVYGISVFALRGATIDELAQQTPLIRFPLFTVMTIGTRASRGPSTRTNWPQSPALHGHVRRSRPRG